MKNDKDLAPESVIEVFEERIQAAINRHQNAGSTKEVLTKALERELYRIRIVNGGRIPDTIAKMLEENNF